MRLQQRKYSRDLRPKRSRVAILHTEQYSDKLDDLVYDGLRLFNLNIRGKSILLKPNLVEYIPGRPVNTNTQLIGSAAEAFLRVGAASVTVAEGPGHHRDTELLVYETGLAGQLGHRKIQFVDLNRDELVKTKLRANYSGLGHLWLPRTVLAADFIVSMPKVKTLHWAGIHESILDICATVRPHFAIADAIVGMEGDGPLNGSPKHLKTLLLADDAVAADASLARLMGCDPTRVTHIREAALFLGNVADERVSHLT
jgi:uncharacterized protein (DUF362 family)